MPNFTNWGWAPHAISAEHGEGITDLVEAALAGFSRRGKLEQAGRRRPHRRRRPPECGKSTLVNTLVGEERVVTFDQPGTTRDAIDVELTLKGRRYVLVDTAGLRRRGRVFESVEKFSVVKTLQAVDRAHVAISCFDAQSDISDQDAHIAGFILERGRAVVVACEQVGRARMLTRATRRSAQLRASCGSSRSRISLHLRARRPGCRSHARVGGRRLPGGDGEAAHSQAHARAHCRGGEAGAARSGLSRPKLRYAHQGGSNPPIVVVHGTALSAVPESYRRYLEADFRKASAWKARRCGSNSRAAEPFRGLIHLSMGAGGLGARKSRIQKHFEVA